MRFFRVIRKDNDHEICIAKITDKGIITNYIMTIHRGLLFSGSTLHSSEADQEKYFNEFGIKNNDDTIFLDGVIKRHEKALQAGEVLLTAAKLGASNLIDLNPAAKTFKKPQW